MPVSLNLYFVLSLALLPLTTYGDEVDNTICKTNSDFHKNELIVNKTPDGALLHTNSYAAKDEKYASKIDSLKTFLKERNSAFEASVICEIGSLHYRNSNFIKGLNCANEAISIGQSLNDTSVIIRALRLFADNYYAQARYELSTDYFLKELEYQRNSGNKKKIAEIYCNIGVNYEERGLLEKGMFYYLEALKIYEKIDDKEGIVASLCNLSFIYRSQGKNAEAITALEKANAIEKQYLEVKKDHYYLANIAEAYINMRQFQKASEYLIKAEVILKKIKTPDDEDLMIWVDAAKLHADIYLEEGNQNDAYKKYLEALELSQKTGYLEKEGKVLVALGKMLMKTYNYKEAAIYLSRGLEIAEESGSFYLKKDIYSTLSEIVAKQNNFRQAWEYQKLYSIVSDSVINIESARQLANFEASYEKEKKESQIQLLQKEKEIQNLQLQKSESRIIYLAVVTLLLLALSGIILNRFRLKKRSAAELTLLNATKDKFFAIIAHDLKNPVSAFNNIAKQVNTHLQSLSSDELKYYISQLSDTSSTLLSLLNNLLEWSRSQNRQLYTELKEIHPAEIVKNAIHEVSVPAKAKNIEILTGDINIQPFLSDSNILGTVIRNLLSNAVKFSPEGSIVKVQTEIDHYEYIITIADQGPGLSAEDINKLFRIEVDTKTIGAPENKGSGIGLIICYEFLKKIGGRIWAESKPDQGCTFSIAIPLQNHKIIKSEK